MFLTYETIKAISERYGAAKDLVKLNGAINGPYPTPSKQGGDWQDYLVLSSDPDIETWTVSGHPGPLGCNCPDYKNRFELHGGYCKHVLAVTMITQDGDLCIQAVVSEFTPPPLSPEIEQDIEDMYGKYVAKGKK